MEGCAPKIPTTLTTPSLNRGVGFTHEQRRELGLTGRLPSGVLTLDEQAERVWRQLQSMPTDLALACRIPPAAHSYAIPTGTCGLPGEATAR
jgi:hypothetical protein